MQLALVTYGTTADPESFSLFCFLFVICHTLWPAILHRVIIVVTRICENLTGSVSVWKMYIQLFKIEEK